MKNKDMAYSYFRQAKVRINFLQQAFNESNFPYVVREAQECVELSLKCLLRYAGIEPPKWHDVGAILEKNKNRFPVWIQEKIHNFVNYSKELANLREVSFYGDDEKGIPPEEIITKEQAENALKWAKEIIDCIEKNIKYG